jgi:DNA-binding response OmpR family regulator
MSAIKQATQDSVHSPPHHLFLVEDDPDMARALSMGLRSEGFSVQTTGSARGAEEHLKRERVDLLIVDWFLSDGNGAQVCAAAREVNPNMPIIAMSGLIAKIPPGPDEHKPNVFLEKPLSIPELFMHIRALLSTVNND